MSFQESFKKYQRTQDLSKRIDSWQKRPNKSESYWIENTLEAIETDSPEYFLLVFLGAWKAQQWAAKKVTQDMIKDRLGSHVR